ncbi:MAG: transglutaminase family protein [Roseateles sp.]|uniref:transglutaminase family protein n=1 Tax=Roseateles sp. TaxID=1971397 RepID=UPI0039EB8AE3
MGRLGRALCIICTWCAGALVPMSCAWAAPELSPLRAQFELADDHIDYGETKLLVDRVIAPETDTDSVRRQLDQWELAIRGMLPAHPTPRQILDTLLKTLYLAGPWNQGRPFSYDLSDPLGRNPKNKLLATYLANRKGNCVSMPILVAILGQRLHLPVTFATAPSHVLVKFGDKQQGIWLNVEATAGGFKSDSSYERETNISASAIKNGIYLRPLTPHEGVGVIAATLMEHYAAQKNGDALMAVADLALKANPRDAVAMVWKANAYHLQTEQRITSRYPNASDMPPALRETYHRLTRENLAWFAKAEALGWTQETPEQEADYLQSIEREQARRSP